MKCDFCIKEISGATSTLISPDKLRAIVKSGFKFSDLNLPSNNPVYVKVREEGFTKAEYDDFWGSFSVAKSDSDWAACNECYKKLVGDEEKSSGKEGCFIATEIYGSYDSSPVLVLRQYRDKKLLTSTLGSLFIRFYYSVSPTIVKYIRDKKHLKKIIKSVLDKLINNLKG